MEGPPPPLKLRPSTSDDFTVDSENCTREQLRAGNGFFASICGRRDAQEDRFCGKTFTCPLGEVHAVIVVDGHGGKVAAEFVKMHLIEIAQISFQDLKEIEETKSKIENAFVDCHRLLKIKHPFNESGACVLASFTFNQQYVIGTAGDCRALALNKSGTFEIITPEHKASLASEKERVEAAGVSVIYDRVGGSLAVSRAIGDFDFAGKNFNYHEKLHAVTCFPDVLIYPKNEDLFAIILMTDGLYESLSMEDLAIMILKNEKSSEELCTEIVNRALMQGSSDNITVALIPVEKL